MKKRILSVVLSVALLLGAVSVVGITSAAENYNSKDLEDAITVLQAPMTVSESQAETVSEIQMFKDLGTNLISSATICAGTPADGMTDFIRKGVKEYKGQTTDEYTDAGDYWQPKARVYALQKLCDNKVGAYAPATNIDGKNVWPVYRTNKASFMSNDGQVLDPVSGEPTSATGWAQMGIKLNMRTDVDKVMVAGSCSDGTIGIYQVLEIFFSDDPATLFDSANRKVVYSNVQAQAYGIVVDIKKYLGAAVTASCVGFRIAAGPYSQARLDELGIYGTLNDNGVDPNATVIDATTASKIPTGNMLAGATKIVGSFDKTLNDSAKLFDGLIYGVTGTDDIALGSRVNLVGSGSETEVIGKSGDEITKAYNWASIGFDMGAKVSMEKFLFAGSGADEVNFQGKYNNRDILSVKFYTSDSSDTLFEDTNLTYWLDNVENAQLCLLVTLPKAVEARYVGFKMTTAAYGIARLSELAVYGQRGGEPIEATTGTPITEANKDIIPDNDKNLIKGAEMISGSTDPAANNLAYAYDGVIYGVTSSEETALPSRFSFLGSNSVVSAADGSIIAKAGGWANVVFKLENPTIITSFLVAGSGSDNANYQNKYDNKNPLAFEMYVGNDSSVFTADRLAARVDNYKNPALAMLVDLDKPMVGQFIGFRFTCGAYALARLSELGLYGEAMQEAMPVTADKAFLMQLLGDNLLAGMTPADATPDKDHPWANAVDGKVYGINTTEPADNTYTAMPAQDGWAQFSFNVGDSIRAEKLFLAAKDGETVKGYEFYMSRKEEDLFTDAKRFYTGSAVDAQALFITLPKSASGRYLGVRLATDGDYANFSELGVYGAIGEKDELLTLDGAARVSAFQINARGFDNKTAIQDAEGTPGAGNTGTYKGKRDIWKINGEMDLLTDGDTNTRSACGVTGFADTVTYHIDPNVGWLVYIYYLGGEAQLDKVTLWSSDEPNYYVTGCQMYASRNFDDLFKNEALLYTTGGEYYDVDGFGEMICRASTESNVRAQEYTLTPEQKENIYRYVAFVVTRPYKIGQNGWGLSRTTELSAQGTIVKEEEKLNDTFTATSPTLGEVTMTVKPESYDDREFFTSIDHMVVEENKIPANLNKNICSNWLTADKDILYHVYLVDKDGNKITDQQLGDRECQILLKPQVSYNLTAAIVENGTFRRMYNSYIRRDGILKIGDPGYPNYGEIYANNTNLAKLYSCDVQFSLFRYNDIDTVNKLNKEVRNKTIYEFAPTGTAGVTDTAFPWMAVIPAAVVLIAGAALAVVLFRRRKAARNEQ